MKKIVLISFVLMSFNMLAQAPGGRGRQQNRNMQLQETQTEKKLSASELAGVFYYDIKKVIKKTKVKDEKKQFQFSKVLKNYNLKITQISFLNTEKFEELDLLMNSLPKRSRKQSMQSMNDGFERNNDIRKKIGAIIRPVKDEIAACESELNLLLKEILSEKQLKKWYKYQKKKKDSLRPKQQQNRENENARPNRSGGGMRGAMR